MDVTCERCRTAYEFDDALVSERGTTVKCTNCGHQFKVRRAEPLGAPERWLVRTIDGREIEFRALRELQAAIAQSLITRDDVLSRGGARPRRLGSIAELEPFFAAAARGQQPSAHSTAPGLGARPRIPTPQGLGIVNLPPAGPRPSEVSVAIPLPKGIRDVIAGLPRDVINGLDDDTMVIPPGNAPRPAPSASQPRGPTPIPPQARASAPGSPSPLGTVVSADGAPPLPIFDPETERYLKPPTAMDRAPPQATDDLALAFLPPVVEPAASRPAPPTPAILPGGYVPEVPLDPPVPAGISRFPDSSPFSAGRGSMSPMTPTPSMARASMRASDELYNEPRFSSLAPPRRTGAVRWIVGFVVVGMFALAFATVGRRYLASTSAVGVVDERIVPLLQEGEKSLLDGDLDGAQEQFAKASVLGEKDPHVAADLARLAAVRADVAWLRVRVLPEGDPDLGTAKRELAQAAERAQKSADRAAALAPTDATVVRARIDALRVSGDLAGARKLVSGVSASGAQPDNALALAQLDLAEDKPDWPTVLDRLRTALGGDQNLGRARSMLVYALARSGDSIAAKGELERLAALPRPHPLLRPLRAFVGRAEPSAPEASAKAGAKPSATAAITNAPVVPPSPPGRDKPVDVPRPPPDKPAGGNAPPSVPVDTSDLPAIKPPPPRATVDTPPAPPPPPIVPPGVDTSDLPGFK